MKRALLIVLDSVGCGHAPDAAAYGDAGANTLGHLFERVPGFELPHLARLGLYEVLRQGDPDLPLCSPPLHPAAAHFRLTERSAGKDTTTGHWELAGCVLEQPFDTFEAFPDELLAEIASEGGAEGWLGNVAASGTEILERLGAEHLRSGLPIVYTSADSVLQIAAHEEAFGLERLWALCRTARQVLDRRGLRIGRVIARPFLGDHAGNFRRTGNRHDYSLTPPETMLDRLVASGVKVVGIGKISDIFAGRGLSESHPTASNAEGMQCIDRLWVEASSQPCFLFANLVDFDTLYGHRRDPEGYAQCLREFDAWLGDFLEKIGPEDLVFITADHGNDPYHAGTDHTREQVPLLAVGGDFTEKKPEEFRDVARGVEGYFEDSHE